MMRLHFIFAPHAEHETVKEVGRKLYELKGRGIRPLFIGAEGIYTSRKDATYIDGLFQKLQLGLNEKGICAPTTFEKFMTLLEQLKPEKKENIHGLGVMTTAALFGIPFESIETTNPKLNKKIKRLGKLWETTLERGISEDLQPDFEIDRALKIYKRYYFADTDMNLNRHETVAKNLFKLAKPSRDGHAVIIFGAAHLGMEDHVRDYLKANGVEVKIEKPVIKGHNQIGHDLMLERYVNPRFKPSDLQFKQAILHAAVQTTMLKHIAEKYGVEYASRKNSEYLRVMDRTKSAITKMEPSELEETLKNTETINRFIDKYYAKK